MLARVIPLKPERIYAVVFHDAFLAEIAGHPRHDELLDEIDRDLSISEKHLPRDTITKVHSTKGVDIWRHKPGTDKGIRVLFSPRGKDRHVVLFIPRRTDYTKKDLDKAVERILGALPRSAEEKEW